MMNTEWRPMLALMRAARWSSSYKTLRAMLHVLALERRRSKHMTKLFEHQSLSLYNSAKSLCRLQADAVERARQDAADLKAVEEADAAEAEAQRAFRARLDAAYDREAREALLSFNE